MSSPQTLDEPARLEEDTALSPITEGEYPRILVVDDEVHILKAVQRMFLGRDVEIVVATNGEEAIEKLAESPMTVLVSDQRMPGLSGTALLRHARTHFPLTVRVMLTGNNDLATAIDAINQGAVFRFVSKPWDHNEFIAIIDAAIEHHELLRSKTRYDQFVEEQNLKLRELNEKLESRVQARTAEVRKLYRELELSFDASIKALLSIMELGDIRIVDHCQHTAQRVRDFSEYLQLDDVVSRTLERAALLHWLGLINAPAELFRKPIRDFDASEQASWEFHPLLGQQAIDHVPALKPAGEVILNYLRNYDDESFRPGKVVEGHDVTLDANTVLSCRILNICSAFERAFTRHRRRGITDPHASFEDAIKILKAGRATVYDPDLVDHFIELVSGEHVVTHNQELAIGFDALVQGMVLSRPLETAQGIPVAPRDMIITGELLARLKRFNDSNGLSEIFVWE
ncbi:MAG: response regulator [Bradymonadaceae bacterium]|nr:response regulator [Lujinxingiaceae bacterium]